MTSDYTLSERWFEILTNSYEAIKQEEKAKEFHFKPDEQRLIVEIGVFEGGSICWWADNFLEHPKSKIIGIDPFTGSSEHHADKHYEAALANLEYTARSNVAKTKHPGKVELVRGCSWDVYPQLAKDLKDGIDILYIDGSHATADVVRDAALYAPHVKSGGAVIFDDYGHEDVNRAAQACIKSFLEVRYALATSGWQFWACVK